MRIYTDLNSILNFYFYFFQSYQLLSRLPTYTTPASIACDSGSHEMVPQRRTALRSDLAPVAVLPPKFVTPLQDLVTRYSYLPSHQSARNARATLPITYRPTANLQPLSAWKAPNHHHRAHSTATSLVGEPAAQYLRRLS
jgi:hypothetical protein